MQMLTSAIAGSNDAVLQERARLSRDLHDTVLQTFYAITLTASRARKLVAQSEDYELRYMLDEVVHLANTGGSELRAVVTNIRSERLTSGALHNVIRHASAVRVELVLDVLGEELVLLITDHGRGFDATALRRGHFGLQSMRERAAAVGGTLEVVSAPATGTQVRACIPLHEEHA